MISVWVGSIILLGIAILYCVLAMGLPYGKFAMGGKYEVMPTQMRAACVVSVVFQFFAILVLLQKGQVISIGLSTGLARGICYVFAAYLTLNTVMNGLSKSKSEKIAMTPLSLVAAICFWVTAIR